jgi:hypothetical protein
LGADEQTDCATIRNSRRMNGILKLIEYRDWKAAGRTKTKQAIVSKKHFLVTFIIIGKVKQSKREKVPKNNQ